MAGAGILRINPPPSQVQRSSTTPGELHRQRERLALKSTLVGATTAPLRCCYLPREKVLLFWGWTRWWCTCYAQHVSVSWCTAPNLWVRNIVVPRFFWLRRIILGSLIAIPLMFRLRTRCVYVFPDFWLLFLDVHACFLYQWMCPTHSKKCYSREFIQPWGEMSSYGNQQCQGCAFKDEQNITLYAHQFVVTYARRSVNGRSIRVFHCTSSHPVAVDHWSPITVALGMPWLVMLDNHHSPIAQPLFYWPLIISHNLCINHYR